MPVSRLENRRILFLLDSLTVGGTERACLALARYFAGEGARPDVFILKDDQSLADEMPPNSSLIINPIGNTRLRKAAFSSIARLADVCAGYDDIVPATPYTSALLMAAAFRRKLPSVTAWAHFPYRQFVASGRWFAPHLFSARFAYPFMDRIVFVSASSSRDMPFKRKGQVRAVIPNPFSPVDYVKPATHVGFIRSLKASGIPVIGAVTRFSREKNVEGMLDVHRELARRGLHSHLVVMGDGDTLPELRLRRESSDLREFIHFPGREANPIAVLAELDVMLMTSQFESWGMTVMESLVAGTPVVAYASTGPIEILEGSLAAGLVPQGQTSKLADVVLFALSNKTALMRDAHIPLTKASPEAVLDAWRGILPSSFCGGKA